MKRLPILLLGWASACSVDPRSERVAQIASPAELGGLDSVFNLATSLSDARGADARGREVASLATGGLRVKFNDASGAPWVTADGARVGASCGTTFVAPSFAITAAHCVDGNDTDETDIVVEMYRPTPALDEGFRTATVVSGTFPVYEHERLDSSNGYHTDRYSCQVASRCGDAYVPVACDPAVSATADTLLLECEGRPGEKYGYVDVATADDMTAEVFMPWKHEVYDIDASPAADLLARYVVLPSDVADNYHYLSVSSTGLENHQLLPLISIPYAPDTPHQKLSSSTNGVVTDLLGCHGTSGSGVMQRGQNGLWEILGPARFGEQELGTYLCNHIPALVGPEHVAGGAGVGYTPLDATQYVVGRHRERVTENCPALPTGATTLLTHLDCPRQHLAAQPENAALAALLERPDTPSPLEALGSWVFAVPEGSPASFTGFSVSAGTAYRLGLEGAAVGGCATGGCPELRVSVDGTEVLRTTAFDLGGASTNLAETFTAESTGSIKVDFSVTGGTLELGPLTVLPLDHVLRFDQAHERLDAVLIDTGTPDAAPSLMRFVGDGVEGFEARLLPSERMALPHLALLPGVDVTATFDTNAGAVLTCGLLGQDLALLSAVDCSSGTVTLPAAIGPEPPRGLYVENASTDDAALLDNLRVVTSEPADSDGDGLTDSADDCPTGGLPTEAALLGLASTIERELCVPAPTSITLPLPDLSSLAGCELELESAALVAVQGRMLDEPSAISQAEPAVELGPGTHTLAWTLHAPANGEESQLEQNLELTERVDVACCADDQTAWEGTPGDESHYAETPVCALAGDGADVVRGSASADWLCGGSGSDYLNGELGNDVILGGEGDDVLTGGVDGDVAVYAGAGDDTVQLTHARSSLVYAGPGADRIVASSGSDTVYPGPGASTVSTGRGNDSVILLDACEVTEGMVLDGGEGEDVLYSPLSSSELEDRGVTLRGFESVVVDTSRSYLAECFGDAT